LIPHTGGQNASIQLEESHIFEADDAELITETLKSKVSRYALAWKFGPDAPQYAYIQVNTTPRQDVANDVAADTFLAPFGILGKKTTLQRYGRPLPDEDEELLKPAAAAAPDPNTVGRGSAEPKLNPATGQGHARTGHPATDKRERDADGQCLQRLAPWRALP
jgi:hypothetical protein